MAKSSSVKAKALKASPKKNTSPSNSKTMTFKAAHNTVTDGIKKHGKAPKTTKHYEGYIRQGNVFAEQFSLEESEAESRWKDRGNEEANLLAAEGEDEMSLGDEARMHPEFRKSLSGLPIEPTPLAISMFLANRCITHGLSKSTASGIHAAFLRHYDQMKGDKYRGRWHYDRVAQEWVGNPVRSAEVEDMLEACKNKDGEGERRHSQAMSIQDMHSLFNYFQMHCPSVNPSLPYSAQKKEIIERGTYLLFNAFSSSAFTVWMRIGEVSTLQYKNLEFPHGCQKKENSDSHFFKLNLRNRKNWQKREKNGDHQLSGHTYQIYPQCKTPEIDMYTHMLEWLDFYEKYLLGRPLTDDNYIFPTIGSSGTSVQPDRPISPDIAQKKIVQMAEMAGIPGAKYFTTHCFCRGGAQYRFMYAPLGERWILARVRWWGGWATGEHRDTLIRYLLDELYTYEEDHSNALCPTLHPKILESVPEMQLLEGFTHEVTNQVTMMKSELDECRSFIRHTTTTPNGLPFNPQLGQVYAQLDGARAGFTMPSAVPDFIPQALPPAIPSSWQNIDTVSAITTLPPSRSCSSSSSQQLPDSDIPLHIIHLVPGLSCGRSANAYEQVIKDWECADPHRSLYVALKDWRPEWHKARNQTQKYSQRQTVAVEFINHYNRDTSRFEAAYPEHKKGFMPLLNAIRAAKQKRGDCEERFSRRKH